MGVNHERNVWGRQMGGGGTCGLGAAERGKAQWACGACTSVRNGVLPETAGLDPRRDASARTPRRLRPVSTAPASAPNGDSTLPSLMRGGYGRRVLLVIRPYGRRPAQCGIAGAHLHLPRYDTTHRDWPFRPNRFTKHLPLSQFQTDPNPKLV